VSGTSTRVCCCPCCSTTTYPVSSIPRKCLVYDALTDLLHHSRGPTPSPAPTLRLLTVAVPETLRNLRDFVTQLGHIICGSVDYVRPLLSRFRGGTLTVVTKCRRGRCVAASVREVWQQGILRSYSERMQICRHERNYHLASVHLARRCSRGVSVWPGRAAVHAWGVTSALSQICTSTEAVVIS